MRLRILHFDTKRLAHLFHGRSRHIRRRLGSDKETVFYKSAHLLSGAFLHSALTSYHKTSKEFHLGSKTSCLSHAVHSGLSLQSPPPLG